MLRLRMSRSYFWLFVVYLAVFFSIDAVCKAFGHASWGVLTAPVFIAFVILCELRSEVALDFWWRANYQKDNWRFRPLIAWHVAVLILVSTLSFFFIYLQ
jgi:hypothetical protein